jgi:hypothetical protein
MAGPSQPFDKALAAISKSEVTITPSGSTATIDLSASNTTLLNMTSGSGLCTITLTPPSFQGYFTISVKSHASSVRNLAFVSTSTIQWRGTQPNWASQTANTTEIIGGAYIGGVIYLAAAKYAELLSTEQIVGMAELALYDVPNETFVREKWSEGELDFYQGLTGTTKATTELGSSFQVPVARITGTLGKAGWAYVSTTGNNATASLGNPHKPYATLASALAANPSAVELGPGTFTANLNSRAAVLPIYGIAGQTVVNWSFTAAVDVAIDLNLASDRSVEINFLGQADNGETGTDATDPENLENGGDGGAGGSVTGELTLDGCLVDVSGLSAGSGGAGGAGVNGGDSGSPGSDGVYSIAFTAKNSVVDGDSGRFTITNQYSTIDGVFMSVSAFQNGGSTGSGNIVRSLGATLTSATVAGPLTISGANGKLVLPRVNTANRTGQAKADGDLFIDDTTGDTTLRIAGVDTLTMAGRPVTDYLPHIEYARRFKSVDTFVAGAQLTSVVAGTGVAGNGNNGSGRVARTGANANSTARWIYMGSGSLGATQAYHIVEGVATEVLPFAKPLYLFFRLNWQTNISTGIGVTNYARVYCGANPSAATTLLDRRGIGIHVNNLRQIILVAHNGTSLTSSAAIEVIPAASTGYTLYSDGSGNVSLWRNSTFLTSVTGGPTSSGTSGSSPFSWESGSGASAYDQSVNVTDFTYGFLP